MAQRLIVISIILAAVSAVDCGAEQIPGGGFEGGPEALEELWSRGEGVTVERGDAADGDWLLRCACVESGRAS